LDMRRRDYSEVIRHVSETAARLPSVEERMRAVVECLWREMEVKSVSWLGFYLINDARNAMTLFYCLPRPACSPIGLHGVCGKAWREREAQVVEDVHALGEGHIVCDPANLSEVVVPCLSQDGSCWGVLDLDSRENAAFSRDDASGLARVLRAAALTV